VQALLAHNAKVYVAARSQEKAEQAIKDLKEATGKEGIFLKLDLSDLPSIKAAAQEFLRYDSASSSRTLPVKLGFVVKKKSFMFSSTTRRSISIAMDVPC